MLEIFLLQMFRSILNLNLSGAKQVSILRKFKMVTLKGVDLRFGRWTDPILSSDFLRSTHSLKKSSSWFVHLLSKRPNHEKDFFQIMCASQKVRTLL